MGNRSGIRFISPAVQREQIETWGKLHGASIGEIFEELDESGGRGDRPLFLEAIERVERGVSQGIVVAKLDRFGRSLTHALAAIERIQAAGGTFVAVEDGLDLTTDTGRFLLRVLLSMAEWELDRNRANWAVAQTRAIARGAVMGPTPTGYRRRDGGPLLPEPRVAPLVSEFFERRAAGATLAELVRLANDRGITTHRGSRYWSRATVSNILRNRVYLGEARFGGEVKIDAHKALTTAATWHRCQNVAERPATRSDAPPALLRGLLRCATCRRLMKSAIPYSGTAYAHRVYMCQRTGAAGPCPKPAYIRDTLIEPHVEAFFWQELERAQSTSEGREAQRLASEVERREALLVEYRDSTRLQQSLGLERFEQGVDARARRLEAALLKLHRAERRGSRPSLRPADELWAQWPQLAIPERRAWIAELLDCVFVEPYGQATIHRAFVCVRGTAPVELPGWASTTKREPRLRRFDPRAHGPRPRLSAKWTRRWTERHIKDALTAFLSQQQTWPSFLEFQEAGQALAYEQLQLRGGPQYWADVFGLRWRRPKHIESDWPDDRVRSELADFLKGRKKWPNEAEFRAAGLRRLRDAVAQTGGAPRWASEFGLYAKPQAHGPRVRWTDDRIHRALTELIGDREDWPSAQDFAAADLLPLLQSLRERKLQDVWAERLGVTRTRRPPRPPRWTESVLEDALRRFVAGRDTWPRRGEFDRAGRRDLERAAARHHGHDYWADRFGLPRAEPLRRSTKRPMG